MKNTNQNLKNYERSTAIKNYHLTNKYDELIEIYSSDIGVLLEDCIKILVSFKLFK